MFFLCFQINMVLPITKLLLKHAFLKAVGVDNEVILQSIRSIHNHAGQESSSEAGPFFHYARTDKCAAQ